MPAKNQYAFSLDPALVGKVDLLLQGQPRSALVESLLQGWVARQAGHRDIRKAKRTRVPRPRPATIFHGEGL